MISILTVRLPCHFIDLLDMPRLQSSLQLMLAAEIDISIELVRVGNASVQDIVLKPFRTHLLVVVVVHLGC